jgi:hypothetical protein
MSRLVGPSRRRRTAGAPRDGGERETAACAAAGWVRRNFEARVRKRRRLQSAQLRPLLLARASQEEGVRVARTSGDQHASDLINAISLAASTSTNPGKSATVQARGQKENIIQRHENALLCLRGFLSVTAPIRTCSLLLRSFLGFSSLHPLRFFLLDLVNYWIHY